MAARPAPKAPIIGNMIKFIKTLSSLSKVIIAIRSRTKSAIAQLIPPQNPLSAVNIIRENKLNLTLQYLYDIGSVATGASSIETIYLPVFNT